MLIAVKFHNPITAEPFPGGTEDWSHKKHVESSRQPVTCEDKGTHMLLSWTGSSGGAFAGRKCRIRVPLTNISSVFEVDDDKPEKTEKPK